MSVIQCTCISAYMHLRNHKTTCMHAMEISKLQVKKTLTRHQPLSDRAKS